MATNPFHIVIGLETHVQLLTRTKLFCGCSTKFGQPANTATCPVCLGMPGSLPVMNRRAFDLALRAATALDCTIAPFTKWDRKNYWYPDLPKNYQISQYDLPFSTEGSLEIEAALETAGSEVGPGGARRRIGIIRVHLEEDAGKMLHDEQGSGNDSLIDLNRTGTPLLEIVSKPEMTDPREAKAYLEELRLLLRELNISDCEMQEGSLRCDANINLHIPMDGDPDLFAATPLVEIKNLNSFRGVERALKFEAQRQYEEFREKFGKGWEIDTNDARPFLGRRVAQVKQRTQGGLLPVAKATAGWNERREITEIQRRKEEAADYRYFPDPDLVPVTVQPETLESIRAELGELPAAQRIRLQEGFGLSAYDADVLTRQGRALVAYFEQAAGLAKDPKEVCNWVANDILQLLKERRISIADCPIPPVSLAALVMEIHRIGLNKQRAREVFAEMVQGASPAEAIERLGLQPVGDEGQIRELVRQAMAANPKAVADFKKGKTKAADSLKGFVMRQTRGMARTDLVQKVLLEELAKAE